MSLKDEVADGLETLAAADGDALPLPSTSHGVTPTGVQAVRTLRNRRRLVVALNAGTYAALLALFGVLLAHGGVSWLDLALLLAFALSTPWPILGFWNALIGLWLLHGPGDARRAVYPFATLPREDAALQSRVAVVMALRNEDPARAFARLRAMRDEIAASGAGAQFSWFVISDTDRPEVAAQEEALFEAWRAELGPEQRLHYRRRPVNTAMKPGNIADFLERWGDGQDLMLVLDADSYLGAATVLRMVRIVEAHPRLGILQSLAVGLPSRSAFARMFQFGMRHGMRSYTMGASWWAGDCGPYWGHNALVRIAPFRAHCALPLLPGRGPLAGPVLSHDQIEAALMRRAGYEVRVLPEETESFEENPPHLIEFTRRDLRWCQGNMQYGRLIALPGLLPMSRFQIAWAMLMYVGAVAWVAFMALGALKVFDVERTDTPFPAGLGLTLFAVTFIMSLAPKLAGLTDVLLQPGGARAYGGTGRLLVGALLEFLFSVLLGPVVAVRIALFMIGLLFGRTVTWEAQARDSERLSWRTALAWLWPQALFGAALGTLLLVYAPGALVWAAPVLAGLLGAVPFAVLTAAPAAGRVLMRRGLCATPEEVTPPASLVTLDAECARDGVTAPLAAAAAPLPAGLQPVS